MHPIPKGLFEPLAKPLLLSPFRCMGPKHHWLSELFQSHYSNVFHWEPNRFLAENWHLREIFPVYISWDGRIMPSKDSQSVTVMTLLSVAPRRETCFLPWAAIVMLSFATNLDGVWSAFMISLLEMLYWRAFWVISWRNCDLTSTHKDLVMIGRDVVTARREIFILWCNDLNQNWLTWKSIHLPNFSGLVRTRPYKTLQTTWTFKPVPAARKVMIIMRSLMSSSSSKSNGRPLAFPIGVKLLLCACFAFSVKFSRYF